MCLSLEGCRGEGRRCFQPIVQGQWPSESSSNWHISRINCSTSKTNSHIEVGERAFGLGNDANPNAVEV